MSKGEPTLRPKTLDTIFGWWAQELGVNMPELMAEAQGVTLCVSSSLPGVFLFRRGGDLRIAARMPKIDKIHEAILDQTYTTLFTREFWQGIPGMCETTVGPAYLFYLDSLPAKWTHTIPRGMQVRGLSAMDIKAFEEFSAALSPKEREQSGLELGPRPLWGIFQGKQLLAAAGYDSWPGRIAHMGVAVLPEFRGKKLGQVAVQAAARGALARRRIVQYRTDETNLASIGLAKALGLVPFAETLYLHPPASA